MNGRAYQKYNRYYHWWAFVERILIVIALLLFITLYASQSLNYIIMQEGGALLTAQIEKLEGKAISNSQTKINTGSIELTVASNSDYRNIQIYLNGEYYTSFKNKSVSITVKNNDIIEVSGIQNEYPAKIKVSSISDNILGLKTNEEKTVNKDYVTVCRVRLK